MYRFLRNTPPADLVAVHGPAFIAAFLVAEAFYKFHSFTLECLAFLATWFVFDAAATGLRTLVSGRGGRDR